VTGPVTLARPSVLAVYDAALRRAAAGHQAILTLRDDRGDASAVDAAAWCRPHLPGDTRLLGRCSGPTLDVGCGPGRLTGALNRLGCPALGIDVSATAIRLALLRGATVLRRDVFAPLPGHGRWRHLLLADGNIGIGGDPATLLHRCRRLLARDGRLHVEVTAPGTRTWAGTATLGWSGPATLGDRTSEARFRWATVSADGLPALADAAALTIRDTWTEAGRWFATLAAS
jgi:SAM-dependent methyltransferase